MSKHRFVNLPAEGGPVPAPRTPAQTMDDFRIPLPHLTLAARRWHAGQPHKVLALHGWLDNGATWDRLAPDLEGVELVSLDLPGHGQSDNRPKGAFYHFIDWIPDVVEAAQELGWDRFSLLAHSMGAGIAPLVAAAVPQQIVSMVCVEGLGPLVNDPDLSPDQLRKSLRYRVEGTPPVYPDLEAATARLVKRGLSPEGALCLARRGTRSVEGGLIFAHDPLTRWPSRLRMTEPQVRAFLAAIECPTLLISAPDGLPIHWDERVTAVRDIRHLRAPGGHHLHLDHPENIVREVQDFLSKNGRP